MRRALIWLLTLALTAAGVLAAHAVAYRLTGTGSEGVHAYLAHAPQLLAVLVTLTLGALAFTSRAPGLRAWPFPALALAGFAVQEHVERLLHTGELPWLLTRPVFLVGLALQLPVALCSWLLARRLLRAVTEAAPRPTPPRLPRWELELPALADASGTSLFALAAEARGPPPSLQAR
jgi:hypothetical protein